ncbi:MAG: triose-phosphate isomerase [Planctomycetales bacterium 12-60-4]|nr:MAG: triose-phosphate isomerase [Planctomycetales bacterium 12-60-4]
MRRPFVAGNWKMNVTLAPAQALAKAIAAECPAGDSVDIAVCPASPYLLPVRDAIAGSGVQLGAQNAYFAAPGAFTGEVALDMLLDVGCTWVILGHSERRQFFGDTDALINQKLTATRAKGLGAILCVGEMLAERQENRTEAVLETQLTGAFAGVDAAVLDKVVIAYEPVWAIGTGVTASPAQAESAHLFIRNWLAKRYNSTVAEAMRIQYGGSVKPDNAAELLSQPNVDGALVGGASLKPEQFIPIIRAARQTVSA